MAEHGKKCCLNVYVEIAHRKAFTFLQLKTASSISDNCYWFIMLTLVEDCDALISRSAQ